MSLNAVIDALDEKRYDSPFVFGFILEPTSELKRQFDDPKQKGKWVGWSAGSNVRHGVS